MGLAHIAFSRMPWARGNHPLERKKQDPEHPVTQLEFAPGFSDPDWCERGHTGLVLSGSIAFELERGTVAIGQGEAFVLDPGTRHRASNPGTEPVVLFLVSS